MSHHSIDPKAIARQYFRNGNPDFVGFYQFLESIIPKENVVPLNTEDGSISQEASIYYPFIDQIDREFKALAFGKIPFDKDPRGEFVQVYREFHMQVEGRLTNMQRAKLLELMLCVEYDGKLLWNEKQMTAKDIATYLALTYDNFRKNFLPVYTKDDPERGIVPILLKERVGNKVYYRFNEKAIFMGNAIKDKSFVKLFKESLKIVIDNVKTIESGQGDPKAKKLANLKHVKTKKAKQTSALGVLHALMPYFHYQTYYLVKYPERDILLPNEEVEDAIAREGRKKNNKKLVLMPTRTMRRIIVQHTDDKNSMMDNRTLEMHLQTLKRAHALFFEEYGDKRAILLHPHLFFGTRGDGTDAYTKRILGKMDLIKSIKD